MTRRAVKLNAIMICMRDKDECKIYKLKLVLFHMNTSHTLSHDAKKVNEKYTENKSIRYSFIM